MVAKLPEKTDPTSTQTEHEARPAFSERRRARRLVGIWELVLLHTTPSNREAGVSDSLRSADLAWFASAVAATSTPGRRTALLQTSGGRHAIAS
jgi:hypothetical protein